MWDQAWYQATGLEPIRGKRKELERDRGTEDPENLWGRERGTLLYVWIRVWWFVFSSWVLFLFLLQQNVPSDLCNSRDEEEEEVAPWLWRRHLFFSRLLPFLLLPAPLLQLLVALVQLPSPFWRPPSCIGAHPLLWSARSQLIAGTSSLQKSCSSRGEKWRKELVLSLVGWFDFSLPLSLAVSNFFFCTFFFFFFQTPAFYFFANIPTDAFSNPMLDDASSSLAAKLAVTSSWQKTPILLLKEWVLQNANNL